MLLSSADFSSINISWIVSEPVLLVVLVLFSIIYVLMSTVLLYHWRAYGMGHTGVMLARTLFIFISLSLFGIALLSLSYL